MDVKRVLQALAIRAALLTAIMEAVKLAREVHPGSSAAEPTRIIQHSSQGCRPGTSNPFVKELWPRPAPETHHPISLLGN